MQNAAPIRGAVEFHCIRVIIDDPGLANSEYIKIVCYDHILNQCALFNDAVSVYASAYHRRARVGFDI